MMHIYNTCPICGEENRIRVSDKEYFQFLERSSAIQDIFQKYNPMEREFIKTGYCPDCQSVLFGSNYRSKRMERV